MAPISRRSFTRDALAVATAAAVLPSALAQSAPPPTEAKPPAAPALSPPSQAEVDARIDWVLKKYGARLDEAQRADIRRIISGGQAGIDAMRAYPLGNEVEPPVPFRVFTSEAAPKTPRPARRGRGGR